MNKDLFYSKAALNGDRTTKCIANKLGTSKETTLNKLNGTTRWTIEDIAKLVFAWDLSAQDVYDIWFKERVNSEGE